jgi:hypothetical protein
VGGEGTSIRGGISLHPDRPFSGDRSGVGDKHAIVIFSHCGNAHVHSARDLDPLLKFPSCRQALVSGDHSVFESAFDSRSRPTVFFLHEAGGKPGSRAPGGLVVTLGVAVLSMSTRVEFVTAFSPMEVFTFQRGVRQCASAC